MIIDKIENASIYNTISERIAQGLRYLQNIDIESFAIGKKSIDDDLLYAIASEFTTKLKSENILEAHKKYLDIHYIIEGTEQIGVTTLTDQKVSKAYCNEDDYMLFDAPNDTITLKKGMFAIFFPDDLHVPGLHTKKAENVKKIVLKIRL